MEKIVSGGRSLFDLAIGQELRIARRTYTIEGSVSGGMGTVLFASLARGAGSSAFGLLSRRLAIKVPNSGYSSIQNELKKWSLMNHENILPLEMVLATELDGLAAASPRCDGSVRAILKSHGRLPVHAAYAIVRSCAEALIYAYGSHRVLHLDLKPENVLYNRNGNELLNFTYMVADWGISSTKLQESFNFQRSPLLTTNNNAGTLPYMAPERLLSGWESSPSSDIFSLGMLWLELITGNLPFITHKPLQEQLLTGEFLDRAGKSMLDVGVKRKVAEFILRCIYPDPYIRFRSWEVVQKQLRPNWLTRLLL